ncbi:uncharacterized protein LOC133031227 [Cannabis sativa]|uniref:uncharacterized protein LOC133031227 n=1 Tax=Cannabis sativa TaxID=3483 RepID=UPI0029C9E477|nr:uncharacterized protein LOC133031227 [Cannabis sativa]
MAFPSNSHNNMLEGLSTSRAPFFDGVDFPYWKIRMETYLQSIDYDLWHIVCYGPYIPMHVVDGVETVKKYDAYNENDKKMMSKNAKAKYALICGLDRDIFKNIEQASSAHDMWKMLEVLTQKDMVTKILRSLTKAYQGKVVAIQEAKDLSTLPLEELIGSLMNHEIFMNAQEEEEVDKKKKNTIAFKSTSHDDSEASEHGDSDMEDITLLTKKFKKFLKFKKNANRFYKGSNSRESSRKDDQITCYECKKPGHMKTDCPLRKRNRRRAMVATWSESEKESSEDEQHEIANTCFMAIDDKVSNPDHSSDFESESDDDALDMSYDELSKSFNDLFVDFEKLLAKNSTQRKKISLLLEEVEALKVKENEFLIETQCKKCSLFEKDVVNLKAKIDDLNKVVYNFTKGKENFEMMLGSQKCAFSKSGIGYNTSVKQKLLKNFFVKSSSNLNLICTYCNQDGHTKSYCHVKKNGYFGKAIWIQKVLKTNIKGPKVMWVPKRKI